MRSVEDLFKTYIDFKSKRDESELTEADQEILQLYNDAGLRGLTVFELIAELLGRELTAEEEDRICELDHEYSAATGEKPETGWEH